MNELVQENALLREERDLLRKRLGAAQEDCAKSHREVRKINEDLVDANSRLSELDKMKDTFVSMITHELRSPMTTMIGIAESLQAGVYGELSEAQAENVQRIIDSGGRLRQLVNDLLDISKMESGMMQLQREPLDPRAMVEAVTYQLQEQADKAGVKIINKVPLSLPEVYCDGVRVEQILTNLIENAVKFTPDGGSVTISAALNERGITFTVTDTGCGISEAALPHIFDKFIQLHPKKDDRTKGTGLGLAIVKHLVELHGGVVGVKSKEGVGSTFCFTLPLT